MAKNFVRVCGWPCAPAVARDLVRLLAAHKRDMGYDLGVNSIYRTRSEQAQIFTSRYSRGAYSPYGDYRTYQGATWGRTSGLGPVASPDVGSNHTRGYAVDFAVSQGSASFQWLVAHAAEYGFNHVEGASIAEPWHWCWHVAIFPDGTEPDPWEGRGAPDPVYPSDPGMSLDRIPSGAGGGGSIPESEEDDLMRIKNTDTGQIYNVAPEFIAHVDGGDGENKAWDDAGLPGFIEVKSWSFDRLLRQYGVPKGVVDGKGNILDDLNGQGCHVKNGTWSRAQKVERLAYLAQKG